MRSARSDTVEGSLDGWLSDPPCSRRSRRIISLSFYTNVVALCIKGVVGVLCGSQALVADAVHALSDAAGFGVNYLGTCAQSRPSETRLFFQGAFIGTIVFLSGVWVFTDNAIILLAEEPLHPGLLGPVVAGVSVPVNYYLYACSRRASRDSTDSNTFICMVQNKTNLFTACLAFIGTLLADIGFVKCDPLCALLVGCLLLKGSFEVFHHTFAEHEFAASTYKRLVLVLAASLSFFVVGIALHDSLFREEVILIPARGADVTSPVDDVLGRAEYFLIMSGDKIVTTVSNGARYAPGDVSDAFIRTVSINRVNTVLAWKIGAEMFSDLRSAGVRMYYIDRPGTVAQILSDHRHAVFKRARASNVAKGYGRGTTRWLRPW